VYLLAQPHILSVDTLGGVSKSVTKLAEFERRSDECKPLLFGTVIPSSAEDFGRGKMFAVLVPGNPAPVAIGVTEMSSTEAGAYTRPPLSST
jgi:hypothetical protein